jgi:hypothetical protein
MAERGRPKKERPQLAKAPVQFDEDDEFGLTKMQTAFVWHYSQGGCGQTEAARRAGFSFPAMSASKLMNGRDHPNVVKAVRAEQEELRQKYAITPEKTGSMLWKIAETSRKRPLFLCGPPSRVKSASPLIPPKTLINQRLTS